MTEALHQGEIIKIEKIKHPVLVVSKNFFNETGEIIGCPIFRAGTQSPLHIRVQTKEVEGYVQCEKLALLDMRQRGFSMIACIKMRVIGQNVLMANPSHQTFYPHYVSRSKRLHHPRLKDSFPIDASHSFADK